MGYQESYFKMKKSDDFNMLLNVIQNQTKKNFPQSMPVEIITLLKPIDVNLTNTVLHFDKGEKFIYVVGERYGQYSAENFFENCIDVSDYIKDNLEIYFTEYFPSDDIFENNDKTHMAKHEHLNLKKLLM